MSWCNKVTKIFYVNGCSHTAGSEMEAIKSKGSDILRLWVATTDYTKEMHISEEILKRASEGYRKIFYNKIRLFYKAFIKN